MVDILYESVPKSIEPEVVKKIRQRKGLTDKNLTEESEEE